MMLPAKRVTVGGVRCKDEERQRAKGSLFSFPLSSHADPTSLMPVSGLQVHRTVLIALRLRPCLT